MKGGVMNEQTKEINYTPIGVCRHFLLGVFPAPARHLLLVGSLVDSANNLRHWNRRGSGLSGGTQSALVIGGSV
jgi:hypothetical protein